MTYYFVKSSYEGSNSPFIARMFMGILEIRDLIVMTNNDPRNLQITQKQFDHLYEPLLNSLRIALDAARSLNKISLELVEDGQSGRLVRVYPGGGIELINTQNTLLQKEFASVIEHSAIAINHHLPSLMSDIFGKGNSIDFLFDNKKIFEKNILELRSKGSNLLAQYLESVRLWSDPLVREIWDQTKHKRWRLDRVGLNITTVPIVQVSLPRVYDTPVNQYAIKVVDRCCLLVENLIAFGFQNYRLSPIYLLEIPRTERPHHQNKRFQAYPRMQGVDVWTLEYINDANFI